MNRDSRLKNRTVFWQKIYEHVHENLKKQGITIRSRRETELPAERMKPAREIRNIRLESGYTQQDMAKKMGVIQQYISKIENGRENFSIDTLKKIADAPDKRLMVDLRQQKQIQKAIRPAGFFIPGASPRSAQSQSERRAAGRIPLR